MPFNLVFKSLFVKKNQETYANHEIYKVKINWPSFTHVVWLESFKS